MLAYFDSSALVKLCVEEEGSDRAALLWDAAQAAATSRVAVPEVAAALAAAHRGGRIDVGALGTASATWSSLATALAYVEVTSAVATRARPL